MDAPRHARIPFLGDRENYVLDDEKPNISPSRRHPSPRQAVLGDFVRRKPVVVYNSFDALMEPSINALDPLIPQRGHRQDCSPPAGSELSCTGQQSGGLAREGIREGT